MTVALSATQMLKLLSLDENATPELLQNLAANSEVLSMQLSQYNSISTCFNTKFLYELYQTSFHDGFEFVGILITFDMTVNLQRHRLFPSHLLLCQVQGMLRL
jgi:hypothetical protein